jgi:hypothetical protein
MRTISFSVTISASTYKDDVRKSGKGKLLYLLVFLSHPMFSHFLVSKTFSAVIFLQIKNVI